MVPDRQTSGGRDAIGQVKFFKSSEGYGFINVLEPEDMEEDVFFHISNYKADVVYEDWWMEFDIVNSNQGKKAVNLKRVSQPPETELFGTNFNY
jgi:cold shock CspA family protein